MSQFILLSRARDDVAEILNGVALDNRSAAQRIHKAMQKAFRVLAAFPGIGAECGNHDIEFTGLRYWPLKKYRCYLVVYREVPEGVEII